MKAINLIKQSIAAALMIAAISLTGCKKDIRVTSISITDLNDRTVAVGETIEYSAQAWPSDATDRSVT